MTNLEIQANLLEETFGETDLNKNDIPTDFFMKNLLEAVVVRYMKVNNFTVSQAIDEMSLDRDLFIDQVELELTKQNEKNT